MNGYIASTITVHTSSPGRHSNARTRSSRASQGWQSPEQRLALPSVPRAAGHRASPQPASLRQPLPFALRLPARELTFTTRRLQMANGFPYSASLGITSRGVLWGDVSPGPLLSRPRVRLQLLFYSQQPPKLAAGTGESRRNELLPHNDKETPPAQKCRKLHGCLVAFLLIPQQRRQLSSAG